MTSTSEQIRAWRGPAVLTFGFRPFFLGAALWAVAAMVLWVLTLTGNITLPSRFDPASWHAHELLFGYLIAPISGFLLTAVPNWTGRLPIVGWPLGGLFSLWILGRFAVLFSIHLSPVVVAIADVALPVALLAVLGREIVTGRNWRNLIVLAMLAVFALGNAVFHLEAARGHYAAEGYGLRIGLGAAIMMIAVIGGRIIPSFTRNWLVGRRIKNLPTPPMQDFDRLAILGLLLAIVTWIAQPQSRLSAALMFVAGALHVARLLRWSGHRTAREPLLWILHVGYACLPLGAWTIAIEILRPDTIGTASALHFWLVGAIGLMTVAVMTRATLGHTGRRLTAGRGTLAIYIALLISVVSRLAAGQWPEHAMNLYIVAGLTWIAAYSGFVLFYGPALLQPRPAS